MKKLLAALVGAVVLMGSQSSAGAVDFIDEYWTPSAMPNGEGWRSLYIGDNFTLNREPSTMYAEMTVGSNGTAPVSYHCTTVDSAKCVESTLIGANAFLQPCSVSIATNCIETFYAIDAAGNRINAVNAISYPTAATWDFAGNDSINLPVGGSPTVWNIPGVTHGGGNSDYMIQVWVNSHLQKAANTKVTTEEFYVDNFTVNITPVTKVYGRYQKQVAQDVTETYGGSGRGVAHPSLDEWRNCAMIDDGHCQKRQAFPQNYRFGAKVRLHKKITGWLHGRIYDPNATVINTADGGQTIEVIALPVQVPVVGEWYPWSQLTPAIQQYVLDGKTLGGQGIQETKNLASGNFQEISNPYGEQALRSLGLWLPQVKDKASANPSTWTFYNLNRYQLEGADRCITDATDLVGFISTNATAYAAGFPTYNKETQSLDYTVMAPHYTARGEVMQGSYDLRIRSEIARCIYGFTSAPIQASISILSEDGKTQTATETILERDGWLSLSAKGFTFSSPTIRVKLEQTPVVETPTATASPTPTPTITPKKVAILCKKGSKKVTVKGLKPHCPVGYKKVG